MEEDSPQIPSEEAVNNILAASITPNFLLTVVRTIGAFSEAIVAHYESGFSVLPEIQPELKERLPERYFENVTINEPSSPPSSSGVPTTTFIVGTREITSVGFPHVYLAYRSLENFGTPGPPKEPSDEEYSRQLKNSIDFLEGTFYHTLLIESYSANNFVGAEARLDFSLWQADLPDENFNIYMELEYLDFHFSDPTEHTPDKDFILRLLNATVQSQAYTVAVWNVAGTFESVGAATFGQSLLSNTDP